MNPKPNLPGNTPRAQSSLPQKDISEHSRYSRRLTDLTTGEQS